MKLRWKSVDRVTPAPAIEAFKKLYEIGAPALCIEAIARFQAKYFLMSPTAASLLQRLIQEGTISQERLRTWIELNAHGAQIPTRLSALPPDLNARALTSKPRVCCPYLTGERSILLEDATEVATTLWCHVEPRKGTPALTRTFPESLEGDLDHLADLPQHPTTPPYWVLRSLLGSDMDRGAFGEDTRSLLLGAFTAHVMFCRGLVPPRPLAATGNILNGRVLRVEHIAAKISAIRRESPEVCFILLPRANLPDCDDADIIGLTPVPVDTCEDVIRWLEQWATASPRTPVPEVESDASPTLQQRLSPQASDNTTASARSMLLAAVIRLYRTSRTHAILIVLITAVVILSVLYTLNFLLVMLGIHFD